LGGKGVREEKKEVMVNDRVIREGEPDESRKKEWGIAKGGGGGHVGPAICPVTIILLLSTNNHLWFNWEIKVCGRIPSLLHSRPLLLRFGRK